MGEQSLTCPHFIPLWSGMPGPIPRAPYGDVSAVTRGGVGWRDVSTTGGTCRSQEGKRSLSRAEERPWAPFAKRSVRRNAMEPFCVRRAATSSVPCMQSWDTWQRNRSPKPWPETPATNKRDSPPLRRVPHRALHPLPLSVVPQLHIAKRQRMPPSHCTRPGLSPGGAHRIPSPLRGVPSGAERGPGDTF